MAEIQREIIREHEFEEQLEALLPNMEEADDFILGAELLLAFYPESGTPAGPARKVWTLPMAPVREMPVTLYYSFDAEAVRLLAILAHSD